MTTAAPEKILPKGDLFGTVEIDGGPERIKIGTWELTDEPTQLLESCRDSDYWDYPVGPDRLFTLDAAFKTRWLADLRSEAYNQAQSVLCDLNGGRCCIGVAYSSVVATRNDLRLNITETKYLKKLELYTKTPVFGQEGEYKWLGSEGADRVASTRLNELTGLIGSMGNLNHMVKILRPGPDGYDDIEYQDNLAGLNDTGLTFLDIAAIIEADLPARA